MSRVNQASKSDPSEGSTMKANRAISFGALWLCVIAFATRPAIGVENINVPADVRTIQAAINQARSGDQIIVAPGRYLESIDLMGKAIKVRSSGGRDVTVLDGIGSHNSVIRFIRGEGRSTVVSGFTITGGTGNQKIYGPDATIGGGVLILESNPTIQDCRFENNQATYNGGGVYSGYECAPLIRRCEFVSNHAERGGGAYNSFSTANYEDCRFILNMATFGGGGIYNGNNSRPYILNCEFQANLASYNGGGIYDYESNALLEKCVFSRNAANYSGGAVYNGYLSDIRLKRCTFLTPMDDVAGSGGFVLNPTLVYGACCLPEACVQVSEIDCLNAGGKYGGPKSSCDAYICPEFCASDLNLDGVVNASDLARLLSDMGACSPVNQESESESESESELKTEPSPPLGLLDEADFLSSQSSVTLA